MKIKTNLLLLCSLCLFFYAQTVKSDAGLLTLASVCYDTYVDVNTETSTLDVEYEAYKAAVAGAGSYATILSNAFSFGDTLVDLNKLRTALEGEQAKLMLKIKEAVNAEKFYFDKTVYLASKRVQASGSTALKYKNYIFKTQRIGQNLVWEKYALDYKKNNISSNIDDVKAAKRVIKYVDIAGKILDWGQVVWEAGEASYLVGRGEATASDFKDIGRAASKAVIPILGLYDAYSSFTGTNDVIDSFFHNLEDTINLVLDGFEDYASQVISAGYNHEEISEDDFSELAKFRDETVAGLERLLTKTDWFVIIGSLNIVLAGKDDEVKATVNRFKRLIKNLKDLDTDVYIIENYAKGLELRQTKEILKEKDNLENLRDVTLAFERLEAAMFCDQALEKALEFRDAAILAAENIQKASSEAGTIQADEQVSSADTVFNSSTTANGDIQGNVRLTGGTLDLKGQKLRIHGNLIHSGGSLFINNGKLTVDGNYRIQTPNANGGYGNSSGVLKMQFPEDHVLVKGDFFTQSGHNHCPNSSTSYLKAGILEVKGNLTQKNGSTNNLCTKGTHKILLSGERGQVVTLDSMTGFETLELTNSSSQGVQFSPKLSVTHFFPHDTVTTEVKMTGREWTLTSDTVIHGNLELTSSTLDLQGKTLTVDGNFTHSGGNLVVNKGTLVVNGNYRIQRPNANGGYDNSSGVLKMLFPEDHVLVKGDFFTQSGHNHCPNSSTSYLKAGILEVKGNLTQKNGSTNNLCTKGTHKVLLSGERGQVVTLDSMTGFEKLELTNSSSQGVQFFPKSSVTHFFPHDTVTTEVKMTGRKWTLTSDTVINGNLELTSSMLDLHGKTLTVYGNFTHSGGNLVVNKGTLVVNGNYRIQRPNANGGYDNSSGVLKMLFPEDHVLVKGDFFTQSGHNHCPNSSTSYLKAGILEVKGNLTQKNGSTNNLCTKGTHKVLLSGEKGQVVTLDSMTGFETLELTNSSSQGVQFSPKLSVTHFFPHDTVTTEVKMTGREWTLTSDTVIHGNLELTSSTLDLQGKTLTVDGNFTHSGGNLVVNKGTLVVNGNYRIQRPNANGGYDNSSGVLKMLFPEDHVLVKGDFFTQSGHNHCPNSSTSYLKAGILEVKGNLTQKNGSTNNLCTKGTHKILLSGSSRQHIKFDSMTPVVTLEITNHSKEQNEGILFDSRVIITTLFNHRGKVFSLAQTAQEIDFPDYDGDGQRDHLDPYPTSPSNIDSDKDGIPDNLDAFPNNSVDWKDTDQDGIGDNIDEDANGDGILDYLEGVPTITTVTPDKAVFNEAMIFTVTGTNLTSNMGFALSGCISSNTELPGGTEIQRQFICTPREKGSMWGVVKTRSGGFRLYDFNVLVSSDATHSSPVITEVSPFTDTLESVINFTIKGFNLPDGLGFTVEDCEHSNTELSGGTATERTFTCTQYGDAGFKRGLVKDAPGGQILYEFTVEASEVSDPNKLQPKVSSVSPLITTLKGLTIFTVEGTNLTDGMGFTVAECEHSNDELPGGTNTQRQFQCTQYGSPGSKRGLVKDAPSGQILYKFTVEARKDESLEKYPQISQVFSIDENGEPRSTTAQFYGGISVNSDDTFEFTKNNVKPYDNITVNGVILPEADHVGKKADIAVIAFHRPDPNNLSCDPTNEPDGSGYYMFTRGNNYNDNYCIWDVDVPAKAEDKYEAETFPYLDENGQLICNRLEDGSVRPRSTRSEEPHFWQRWNKNLDALSPLFYAEELLPEMPITLYKDTLSYSGHVCLYFGYWLRDLSCQDDNEICCQQPDKNCTLIFNEEPIQFSVSE